MTNAPLISKLSTSFRSPYITIVMILLGAGITEYVLSGTFTVLVITSLLSSTFCLSAKRLYIRPLGALVWFFIVALTPQMSRLSSMKNAHLVLLAMTLTFLIAPNISRRVFRLVYSTGAHSPHGIEIEWTSVLVVISGMTVLFAPSYLRSGGLPAWAMSGDSRNHLMIARDLVDRGGYLWWEEYPSLFNSLVASASGWKFGSGPLKAGALTQLIQIQAAMLLVIIFLLTTCLYATTRSLIVQPTGSVANDRSICNYPVNTKVIIFPLTAILFLASNWILRSVLIEGFYPVALAITISAVFSLVCATTNSFKVTLSAAIFGIVSLLAVFPLAALFPAAVGVFASLFFLLRKLRLMSQSRLHIAGSLLMAFAALAALTLSSISKIAGYINEKLGAYGRIESFQVRPSIILLGVACLFLLAGSGLLSHGAASHRGELSICNFALGYGSVSNFTVSMIALTNVLGPSYYRDKTIVAASAVLVISFLSISSSLSGKWLPHSLLRITSLAGVGALMLFLPLQTSAKFLAPPILPLISGWELPSDDEAAMIGRIDQYSPGSIPYRMTGDPLAQKVMTIWSTTSISGTSEVVTYGYGYDPSDLNDTCRFAAKHSVSVLALDPHHELGFDALC